MNDGHYFINCRLIVCQDGEDVWNKLWNFEPGPGSGSGSGWVAREMSRKYLQATAGAGARCDKHRKLKYLNCELKFSLEEKWRGLLNLWEIFLCHSLRVPATWESWNNKRASHFSAVTSCWCPDLLVVDILICQQSKHYGQEIIPLLYSFHFMERGCGHTFVDINEFKTALKYCFPKQEYRKIFLESCGKRNKLAKNNFR